MKRAAAFFLVAMLPAFVAAGEPFARNERVDSLGTHQISAVEIAPRFLVQVFGKPRPGTDDGKVSGRYTFVTASGTVPFTVYDWHSTSLSEYGADLPTPKSFWSSSSPVEFEVGGRDQDVSVFKEWLLAKYHSWQRARSGTKTR